MIYYHFRDLTDFFEYLKPSGWTYFDLDIEEVTTAESLDYYAILAGCDFEKQRIYSCVQKIGSHQKYAAYVEGAAGHLGSKNDAASKKLIEAQKKADEKSKAQQREQLIKAFKAAANKIYPEAEFSDSERRWSTEPYVHLPKSVEAVEVVGAEDAGGEPEAEEAQSAAKTDKKSKPQAEDAETGDAGGAQKTRGRGVKASASKKSGASKQRLIGKRK